MEYSKEDLMEAKKQLSRDVSLFLKSSLIISDNS